MGVCSWGYYVYFECCLFVSGLSTVVFQMCWLMFPVGELRTVFPGALVGFVLLGVAWSKFVGMYAREGVVTRGNAVSPLPCQKHGGTLTGW